MSMAEQQIDVFSWTPVLPEYNPLTVMQFQTHTLNDCWNENRRYMGYAVKEGDLTPDQVNQWARSYDLTRMEAVVLLPGEATLVLQSVTRVLFGSRIRQRVIINQDGTARHLNINDKSKRRWEESGKQFMPLLPIRADLSDLRSF